MFDNAERKFARIHSGLEDEISESKYNAVLGCCIIYGFLVNAFMVLLLGNFAQSIPMLPFIIGYTASCVAGSIISVKSQNPVVSFIGYNLIVLPIGILLAICLPEYPQVNIIVAAVCAAVVAVGMMVAATLRPERFGVMGNALFDALCFGILAELAAMFFGYRGTLFDWAFVIVFSLYTAYDWVKAQSYPKTVDNAVDSAIDIYLDIINLFIRILDILSKNKRN